MMDNFLTATMKAAGLALLISVLMGPLVIPALTRLKAGQSIREDGPRRHLSKAGTPTMGDNHHHCRFFLVTDSGTEPGSGYLCAGNCSFGAIGFGMIT